MFGDNIVHLIDQVRTLKDEMPDAFLKVTNAEELILVFLLMRIITNMVHQPDGDIAPIVGNRFTIQQIEHTFQSGQLIASPAPVQAKAPTVVCHQITDDDFLTEVARVISFVIPRQPFEYVDYPALEYLLLALL
ncbi:hypothetical protein EDC54_103338 [Samsonia erythrinae]|uniref:Uncharacterized protein n=1 Tax=Samsonia erythrinae TaxID=160434 RepID=A0A4R3VQV1_9GAMM|nr:hypothetical protein EDC54_103338 [Samsonia erythrinae]